MPIEEGIRVYCDPVHLHGPIASATWQLVALTENLPDEVMNGISSRTHHVLNAVAAIARDAAIEVHELSGGEIWPDNVADYGYTALALFSAINAQAVALLTASKEPLLIQRLTTIAHGIRELADQLAKEFAPDSVLYKLLDANPGVHWRFPRSLTAHSN